MLSKILAKWYVYLNSDILMDEFKVSKQVAKNYLYQLNKQGSIVRINTGIYIIKWVNISRERIASLLYKKSYISLFTVLNQAGILTQIYEKVFSVSQSHYSEITINDTVFVNFKGVNDYSTGITYNKEWILMADKERAFLDTLYLHFFSKHLIIDNELFIESLDDQRIMSYLKIYPERIKDYYLKHIQWKKIINID